MYYKQIANNYYKFASDYTTRQFWQRLFCCFGKFCTACKRYFLCTAKEADHISVKGQKIWSINRRKLDSALKMTYVALSRYLDNLKATYARGIKGTIAREKNIFFSNSNFG